MKIYFVPVFGFSRLGCKLFFSGALTFIQKEFMILSMATKTTSANLISIKEAAARLDVSLVTLYKWLNARPPEISYVEIGGDRFVPELEVERIKRDRNQK